MKTVTCIQRGESSDYWPELDEQGNPIFDKGSGLQKAEQRITYFQRGDVLEIPDLMAENLKDLGIAIDGEVAEVDLPPAPGTPAPVEG